MANLQLRRALLPAAYGGMNPVKRTILEGLEPVQKGIERINPMRIGRGLAAGIRKRFTPQRYQMLSKLP